MFTINELSSGADHTTSIFSIKSTLQNNYCGPNKDKIHHLCNDLHLCKEQALLINFTQLNEVFSCAVQWDMAPWCHIPLNGTANILFCSRFLFENKVYSVKYPSGS